MIWPTFDVSHGGVTYSIPYSQISLTEASIDGDELTYTLTVSTQEETAWSARRRRPHDRP